MIGHKVEYWEVDYNDLEDLVTNFYNLDKDTWGRGWSFAADEESRNDVSYTYKIDGKIDDYDEDKLAKFIKNSNNVMYMSSILMNDLCRKGELEPGQYLVKVSW